MPYTPIVPKGSAPPLAPYSPGTKVVNAAGNTIYVSGTLAIDYAAMNQAYREFFPAQRPARYCIRADLVKPEFLVEIASVAHL